MAKILKDDIQKIQVSSVMKNDKQFGKQKIFDECEDTCWSSDEGSPQWILLQLKKTHTVCNFSIQFQGGFVGQNCRAEFTNNEEVFSHYFYPEDINAVQEFGLDKAVLCNQIKFVFGGSTDFFGRVVIYSISISTSE